MFVIAGGLGMVVPILPIFVRDLGASGIWLGLSFSGFAIIQTPLTPIIGRFGDRFGRKKFILAGLTIYIFIGIGLSMASTYQAVTLLRMTMGLGASLMFPSALATIGILAPKEQEGRYMGLFMVSFTAGFGIGPLIGGVIKDALGPEAAFLSLSVAATLALLSFITLMPREEFYESDDKNNMPSISNMLRNQAVISLFIFNLSFGIGLGAVMTFIAIFMTDKLYATATLIGLIIGSRAIISSVLQPLLGRLADRMPRHYLIFMGGILLSVCTSAIPLSDSVLMLFIIFLILGIGESAALPASLAITTDLGSKYGHGTLMGFANAVLVFGLLVGSVGGSLVESTLGIENVFRITGIVTLAMTVIFLITWRKPENLAI
jgi:MFS family permease